jgi:tRNA(Ile2) C34 agmatinyltransferase TiaS
MLPPCPVCKTNKRVEANGRNEYVCLKCGGHFDNDPDEGGTHYSDPSKRMEKQEQRQINQQRNRR